MNILEKYLQWAGVSKPEELTPEEKVTFDNWKLVMNKDELTMDDLKKFMQGQVEAIENRWKDLLVDKESKADLIPYHTIYRILLSVVDAPKAMRESLEIQLNQKINQNVNTR